jgi:hypothetical protein
MMSGDCFFVDYRLLDVSNKILLVDAVEYYEE